MSDDHRALQIPVTKLLSGSESHHMQQTSSSSSSHSSHSSTTKTTSTKKATSSSVMTVKKSTVKTSSTTTKGGSPVIHEGSTVTSVESSTKQGPVSIHQEDSSITTVKRSAHEGQTAIKDSSSFSSIKSSAHEGHTSLTSGDDLADITSIMSTAFGDLDNPASMLVDSSLKSLKEGSSTVTVQKSVKEGPGTFSQSMVTTKKSMTQQGPASIVEESTITTRRSSSTHQGLTSLQDVTTLPSIPSSALEYPVSVKESISQASFSEDSSLSTVNRSDLESISSNREEFNSAQIPIIESPVSSNEDFSLSSLKEDSSLTIKKKSAEENLNITENSATVTNLTNVQDNVIPIQQKPVPVEEVPAVVKEGSTLLQETTSMTRTLSSNTLSSSSKAPGATSTATVSTRTEEATCLTPGLSVEVPISVIKPATLPGTQPFDMTASVKSPSGVTELCDVKALDDSHYSIKFVPHEMGVHTVSVKHKDMHIPGSPFEFTVGPIAGGGSHKVHAAGPGLERGEVDVPNEFNIYTREAGAGGLSIAVEGPSKAEIEFQDKKDGSCNVAYRVSEPGEYYVSVKFNDEHIPDSPFRVNVTPSIGDARKLSVQSMQDRNLELGKPAAFVVNFNGAKGRLNAKVVSPSGAEEEALVQEVDDGQYAVRFIPRENGVHLVHVLFDNYHIPGSPFKVVVGKVDADAGKVTAYGDGLKTGRTGQVAKFIVNTVNAGSGSLAVTVEGPSKVKLECKEVDEGYEFSYRPTAPGDYLISIKYAGVQIAGSPFKAKIEGQGQPSAMQEHASVVVETVTKTSTTTQFRGIQRFQSDASKVTANGAGLTKAVKGKTATFTVDASRAGNNIMYVGMMGPKGPCEELIVKHQGNLKYNVQYMVREPGRYMLIVRWGEDDIPGSPFAVEVQ